MNKFLLLMILSLVSVTSYAAPKISFDGELLVLKKEPVLDNGSTNPPPKPPGGNGEKPLK